MIPHIKTAHALIITNADGTILQVGAQHENFEEIATLVSTLHPSPVAYEELESLIRPAIKVQKIISRTDSFFAADQYGNVSCAIDGVEFRLPQNVSQYIIELHKKEHDLGPLLSFVSRMSQNPRREVIEELWGFISACGLCLTDEGHFLAYKNVNNDFTSVWDGSTNNTPGTTVRMRRSDVEHNPHKTCSFGLHFAAWGYLQHYAPGRKTVLLSIDPADVVSIPSDYNNMKGRACAYLVLREVEQPEELKDRVMYRELDYGNDEDDYEEYDDYDSDDDEHYDDEEEYGPSF